MLRFFRLLRRKLLEEGDIRKYIWYAIGEILLVVLGILIALQINNWNEDRILRNKEVKLLSQIQSDLTINASRIDDLIGSLDISRNSADSLIWSFRYKESVAGFSAHISIIHRRFFFSPATSGYAQLRGSLGTIIENDDLRNRLVQLYEVDIREISKTEELIANHLDQILSPLSNALFEIKIGMEFRINDFDENSLEFYDPKNIDTLLENSEYANTVVTQKRLFDIHYNQLFQTGEIMNEVIDLLEQEINERE